MLGSQFRHETLVAPAVDLPDEGGLDGDSLAAARGLMLGLLMGMMSLGALGCLLWWAFA